MKPHPKPHLFQRIARHRIEKLFCEAEKRFRTDSKLSDRYVELARKIAMKYKLRLPSRLQKQFCKHCYCYLVPGSNCSVRLQGNKVTYCCGSCEGYMRFPYVREKKARKKTS